MGWKQAFFATTIIGLATAVSCGGSSDGAITGNLTSVSLVSSTAIGGFTPAITPTVGPNGELKLTVAGVDINNDGTIETPAITKVTASGGAAAAMVAKQITTRGIRCDGGSVIGQGSSELADIGICLDTTSSMGAAAGILADKIVAFATSLDTGGADASFTACTLGDAYATKANPSQFTDAISRGTLGTPPTFDDDERPDTSTGLLAAADMNTFFAEVERVYGDGQGGGDIAENYLGCVDYLNNQTAWREGASRVLISIGDSCSHTPTSAPDADNGPITDPWIPPAGATLEASYLGVATVHVIGPENPACPTDTYDMSNLSSATGGTFTAIGDCTSTDTCEVDLTRTPIGQSITGGIVYLCDGSETTYESDGRFTVTANVRVSTSGGVSETAVVTMLLDLTFAP